MMDPEIKTKWVAALRSDQYRQGNTYLLKDGEYCCLGVLMEIQGADIEEMYPNIEDRATIGIPDEYRAGISRDELVDLGCRNDGSNEYALNMKSFFIGRPDEMPFVPGRHTFKQIADHIERSL